MGIRILLTYLQPSIGMLGNLRGFLGVVQNSDTHLLKVMLGTLKRFPKNDKKKKKKKTKNLRGS